LAKGRIDTLCGGEWTRLLRVQALVHRCATSYYSMMVFLYFTTGRHVPLRNYHFLWGSVPPFNAWFLGSTRVYIPYDISIRSAVFAQLRDHATCHVRSNRPYLCTESVRCGLMTVSDVCVCDCTELPDAPAEVQVEAGPQHGTLLVMWLPVKVTERSCTAAITGYAVYVDGRRVKELHSPTGTVRRCIHYTH